MVGLGVSSLAESAESRAPRCAGRARHLALSTTALGFLLAVAACGGSNAPPATPPPPPIAEAPAAESAPSPPASAPAERTTAEGLRILDRTVGSGREAKSGDVVTVHYDGTLEDGTEFDSSRRRGKPFSVKIGVGQVIKGWDLGIAGMREGGSRRLTIPYPLAYGEAGRPPKIGPRETLVFEVELIEVKPDALD